MLVCAMSVWGMGQAFAQLDAADYGIFNHVGVGVGFGTTGVTIDAASVITPYVGVRAGVDIMPSFKVDTDLDLGQFGYDASVGQAASQYGVSIPGGKIDIQGKPKLTTGHLLFDVYPFPKSSSFRVTLGAYLGSSKIIEVYNREDGALRDIYNYNQRLGQYSVIPASAGKIGAELGDYFLEPRADGNLDAFIKVNSFRPYVGLGFGRAVPKGRVGCQFDLGVQFWGKPKVMISGANGEEKLTEQNAGGDGGDVIKTISKISVYPNISFRIVGRIF